MDENQKKDIEQALERIRVMNDAIELWRTRPHPGTPAYACWKPDIPKRNMSEYWAGRFYKSDEVLESLGRHFGVKTARDVFVHAHICVYGAEATQNTAVFLEQMYADYEAGAKLPPSVLVVYVMLKKHTGFGTPCRGQ